MAYREKEEEKTANLQIGPNMYFVPYCSFLAVQNSSIGDLVPWLVGWLVGWSVTTNNQSLHNTTE